MPIALKDVNVEKANPAVADAHGLGGPAINIFTLQEILLEFLLRNQIGGFVTELSKHTHRAGVGLLGAFPLSIELQDIDHTLIPIVHHKNSPPFKKFESKPRRVIYLRTMAVR